jgi:hypothetical protein
MVQRLSERYRPGDHVEICLGDHWVPAQILGSAHPGLWVQTATHHWFITNRRHIRPAAPPKAPASPASPR